MKKEFIPYAEALALKELGFDEPCFGYFTGDLMHLVIRPAMSRVNEPESYVVTAPLYQQAFRWFREKHDLESSIVFHEDYYYKGKTNVYETIIEQRGGDTYLFTPIGGFSAYEEAELECLKKLIEIVKEKL